jgi:hypothetical protein
MQESAIVPKDAAVVELPPREEAIRELERLIASAEELRAALRSTEAIYRKSLRLLKAGTPVSTALAQMSAGATRMALTDVLKSFEFRRHHTRLAFIAAGLADGATIGEVGRVWGFSRTLASRYAKEIRGEH